MAVSLPASNVVSISPLLNALVSDAIKSVTATEIAAALALIFEDRLSPIQSASLLTILRVSKQDRKPQVLAQCARKMRDAATQIDRKALKDMVRRIGREEGSYKGGLCDIVGTGGDGHSTFNISTASSILASSLLLISKHGNRASSSTSGSADLLQSIKPKAPNIEAINSETLVDVYSKSQYAFLFAPNFHGGMKHVAPVRKELSFRTIFNLLGPLANPVEGSIEARIIGVAQRDLGPIFAEALRLSGAKKAMVVCGAEDLDEISCAGKTYCWRLVERLNPAFRGPKNEEDEEHTTSDDEAPPRRIVEIEEFTLEPSDFGFAVHALSEVSPGKLPHENAATLVKLLKNELSRDDPVLEFVLINTAALFVVAGVCEADMSNLGNDDDGKVFMERGPGGGRWREGIRRARWAVESQSAWRSLERFIDVTDSLNK